MPERYPIRRAVRNKRLLDPFCPVFQDLYIEKGHARPKQINMIASKILIIQAFLK